MNMKKKEKQDIDTKVKKKGGEGKIKKTKEGLKRRWGEGEPRIGSLI